MAPAIFSLLRNILLTALSPGSLPVNAMVDKKLLNVQE